MHLIDKLKYYINLLYLSLEMGSSGENDLDLRNFRGGEPETLPAGEIDLLDFFHASLSLSR